MSGNSRQDPWRIKTMRINIEMVTPTQAREWLARNEDNRPITANRVDYFKGVIARKEWRVSPDAIMLTEDANGSGELLNAQHRLTALVECDTPLPFAVLRGATRREQEITDTGQRRTLAHFLAMRHEKNYTTLAASIRALWRYEQDGIPVIRNTQPSTQQGFAVLDHHGDIRNSLWTTKQTGGVLLGSLCPILHYVFANTKWPDAAEDANVFFTALGTGESLGAGDPILALRNRLLAERNRIGRASFAEMEAGLTIKAWNLWQRGGTVTQLRWKSGGSTRELFPRVERCTIFEPPQD